MFEIKNSISKKIIFILFALTIQVQSVDITLSSSMTDTNSDTYSIVSNVVTLKSETEYKLSGTCSECQIVVNKEITTTITLDSISIDNSKTGPFVIKKNSVVNLVLNGESTIIDKETDETLDDYEGAGIKFKSGSSLTISGSGTLNVNGNIKNGIKGASTSILIINGGTFIINAVNNALAADGSVTINDGKITITTSEGDGIKSDPDYGDTESEGAITINGGTFTINSYSDGLQAKNILTINGGTFNIKTYKNGASSTDFNGDEESAKGIKCSNNETSEISLTINGGSFNLDTADDSIHSDGNVTITGGTFTINSGDDGIHADQYLNLGTKDASNDLINVKIEKSYEGLEGAYVYIYSGTYTVYASDDGINSAGDTDTDCAPGNNGNQPGGNGGNPGNNQGGPGGRNFGRNLRRRRLAECNSFHMYIYGGEIFINAGADGLDANGNIEISGGNITVWGAESRSDGDPIDLDGTLTITGGTLLAGGNQAMTQLDRIAKNSQKYISSSSSYTTNNVVYINDGSNIIRSITIPKTIPYLYYTSPSVTSSYKFTTSVSGNSNNENNPSSTNPTISDSTTPTNSNSSSSDDDDDNNFIPVNFGNYLSINLILLLLSLFY